ncbi:Na(+)-translocating NADH-quinone reductase subunit C [Colwellia sp. BRX10-6]|uniref:Na(+)-translocating NADH-quinone reductase subunit C n=1 Tax=unclassified Colwellia TaxID=196834 RepID=UPI0015F4F8BE|nr:MULTISPECIES: Na(+)-translocating NADH-quinone reductase subunit C [unclassified Colwellia]MBA6384326.1 Na(+)-translocating NADH-quinone reductase subunit C [Colwellia sp. BRX10-9]MBA6395717.1 Na(+)-translocating NADH-quinone reductase subunit C [Colwellia sp. BRX10-6]
MSSNKETPIKTIGFVFLVCLVCAALVSVAAISLKPLQQANKLLDKQTKILEASGLLEKAGTDIVGTYNKYVVAKMIDLDSGKIIEGNTDIFDERADARNAAKSSKLTNDTAGINRRANRAVVYLVNNEQGQLNTLVLPIVGSGLWDLMYGYIGLAPDLNTVRSLIYSDLKETPGLGAEVLNPKWKALWPGKKIYNDSDEVAIKVIKGGAKTGDVHGVDALSGATLTSNGVQNTLHFWLGEQGYGPFITKYRSVASEGEMN